MMLIKLQGHFGASLEAKPHRQNPFRERSRVVSFLGSLGPLIFVSRFVGGTVMDRKRILALSLFVLVAGVIPGHAQSTATLSGTVTDPSGAVVAQAQVTVQNLSTSVERVVKSDAAGYYTVPSLQPGNYSISIEAAGFAAYKLPGITLQVDQSVTANAK